MQMCRCADVQIPVGSLQAAVLSSSSCLRDTFPGVLMLQGRQAAKRAVERFPPPGISNGWLDRVSGGGRRGLRAATVKEGEVRYC